MTDQRLRRLIADGPEGLAPELWNVLLEEGRRRAHLLGPPDPLTNPFLTRAVHDDAPEAYVEYVDVPWFRRSGVNTGLLLVGLAFPPAMACVCGTLLTGDIYYNRPGPDGTLKRWPRANRTVALLLFGLQVLGLAFRLLIR